MFDFLKRRFKTNGFIFGQPGSGRAFHPWDDLESCSKCGGAAWFVGKDGKCFESGSPYRVICLKCGHKSTLSDDFMICKDDWNANFKHDSNITLGQPGSGMHFMAKQEKQELIHSILLSTADEIIIVDPERESAERLNYDKLFITRGETND